MVSGEPSLGHPPVRAVMKGDEPLDLAARVNYHKLATIEHNSEVSFIGEIIAEDLPILNRSFQTVIASSVPLD